MAYQLNKLNPNDFEKLIQALTKKILGHGSISFGSGTDGGREATFRGKADFPSHQGAWDGYWVVQAKHKNIDESAIDDFSWIKSQLTIELNKYHKRIKKVEVPDHLLFFTNARLTAVAGAGGRDKANELERDYELKYHIKNIRIISFDDIIDLLNIHREVATAFAPFILSGDVLFQLLNMLEKDEKKVQRTKEVIARYVEAEFLEDVQSKLDHAGKLTQDKVNLEKVFIDLEVVDNNPFLPKEKFVSLVLECGNKIVKFDNSPLTSRHVLVAGPGYGKSTLTQFILQIHRAELLMDMSKRVNILEEVKDFLVDYPELVTQKLNWVRLPFKIALKEYAEWINKTLAAEPHGVVSVTEYLKINIKKKTGETLELAEFENLLQQMPSLFIFDGLDEVPVSSNRGDVLREIKSFTDVFLRRLEADAIIIATTRPQGYSADFDQYKYNHYEIVDMSPMDCEHYLERLLENLIDQAQDREDKMQILKKALKDKVVSKVMKSPLQASIMAILVKSGGDPPNNKYDLFTEYFNVILSREKQRGVLPIISDKPAYIKDIHRKLGLYLQATSEKEINPSGEIDAQEFQSIVSSFLLDKGLEKEDLAEKTDKLMEATTDRLVFISEVKDQKIGFAIRSLQEFFAAEGFIHGMSDEVVRDRINSIARSAYWSNTLLFAISYLAKERPAILYYIESLCAELNGSGEDSGSQSLDSIAKNGSWLALYILNERIFQDNPKLENKFCRFLEPLFYLPYSGKMDDLMLLSDRIIDTWVRTFISEALKKDGANQAAWKILGAMIEKDIQVGDILAGALDNENIFKVASYLSNGRYNDFIMDSFLNAINENTRAEVLEFMKDTSNLSFSLDLCRSARTEVSRRIIFESIFFISLMDHGPIDHAQFYNALGITLASDEKTFGLLYNYTNREQVDIVDGFSLIFSKIGLARATALNKLFVYAEKVRSALVLTFRSFLQQVTLAQYLDFNGQLLSAGEKYRDLVFICIKDLNGFFQKVWIERLVHAHSLQQAIDEVNNIDLEEVKQFPNRNYRSTGSKVLMVSELESRLGDFVSLYSEKTIEEEVFVSFRSFFPWALVNMEPFEQESLAQRLDLISFYGRSLKPSWQKHESIGIVSVLYSLCFFDITEVRSYLETLAHFEKIPYILDLHDYQILPDFSRKSCAVIADVLKIQLLSNAPAPCRYLLQSILTHLKTFNELLHEIIPYSEILNQENVGTDIAKAVIILFDPKISLRHVEVFKEIYLAQENSLGSEKLPHVIILALQSLPVSELTSELLKFIWENREIMGKSYARDLANHIRYYTGNFPSNLSIQKLMKSEYD
ncbi:NACHT domain-containing protein [Pedobacter sp. GSP4]|uniref:NACHT domain-containing protein n=1 Tax=Pedobacter sp. GSP4 TaxID=3453716 RepID=UPI003EF00E3E